MQIDEWARFLGLAVAALVGLLIIWATIRALQRKVAQVRETGAVFAAIDAETKMKRIEAERGTEQAKQIVQDTYRAELEQLNDRQKAQVKILENNPSALANFLVRTRSDK